MAVAICHFSRLFDKEISTGLLKGLKTAFSITPLPCANSLNPQEMRSSCTAVCRNANACACACASALHLQRLGFRHHFLHSQFLGHHFASNRHVKHGQQVAGGAADSSQSEKNQLQNLTVRGAARVKK